jgi:hypothetical protein
MPKATIPTIKNPQHTEIILALSTKEQNSNELSNNTINKSQAQIYRHIKKLKETNWIMHDTNTPNYDKITEEFIIFTKDLILQEEKKQSSKTTRENNLFSNLYDITIKIIRRKINIKQIITEGFIQPIIKGFLEYHQKNKKEQSKITLQEIFKDIIIAYNFYIITSYEDEHDILDIFDNKFPETSNFISGYIQVFTQFNEMFDKGNIIDEVISEKTGKTEH